MRKAFDDLLSIYWWPEVYDTSNRYQLEASEIDWTFV